MAISSKMIGLAFNVLMDHMEIQIWEEQQLVHQLVLQDALSVMQVTIVQHVKVHILKS